MTYTHNSYYNTNRETGETLRESRRKALSQEGRIIALYAGMPGGTALTPEQVHRKAFTSRTPLTSVRRAMTTLTRRGLLERTTEQKVGQYGKKVHTWKVAA